MRFIALNAFINEAGGEILKSLRAPEFIIPTLIMPVAFYALFAIALPGSNQMAPNLLATYGVFGVMGPAIFGFGAGVANEREKKWLDLKRAAPSPALSYIGAKIIATLFFAAMALVLLYGVAGFFAGVVLPRVVWASLIGFHILSALPFICLGLLLGFSFGSNASIAIANIVFLSLAALGGLWIPIGIMPKMIQNIAQFLPSFHAGELALALIDPAGMSLPAQHLLMLVIATGVLAIGAVLAWGRQRT